MAILKHGTLGGYANHKCRCDLCATTFRIYQRAYRAKKKALGLCHWCTQPAVAGQKICQRHIDERKALRDGYRHYVRSQRKGVPDVTAA